MRVVDLEDYAWFLFEHDGKLLLNANCNHSAFGYTWMIELSQDEKEKYEREGRSFLDKLAHDIQYSAPAIKGSNSIYKERDVSKFYSEKTDEAISVWRAKKKRSQSGKGRVFPSPPHTT